MNVAIYEHTADLPVLPESIYFHSRELMELCEQVPRHKPYMAVVTDDDVKLDTEYAVWIGEVKHRYHSIQLNTVVNMNGEKLLSNWQMGRDRVQKKAEEYWSACIVEQVSLDSKRVFPNEEGISNLKLVVYEEVASLLHQSCIIRNTPTSHWRIGKQKDILIL